MLKKVLKIWFWYFVTTYTIYGVSVAFRGAFLKKAIEVADEDRKKELTHPELEFKTTHVLIHSLNNFKESRAYFVEWIKGRS